MPATDPWESFPLVLCMNLRDRADRREEVLGELRRVGLRRVEFFRADRRTDGDRDRGCWESHLACLGRLVASGREQALILEDDVLFQGDHGTHLPRCAEFLRTHPECDFLHLGGFVFRRAGRPAPHFLRGGILTAHAYVVRAAWARELLRHSQHYHGMSIDTFYTILNRNRAVVHVDPLAAIQRPSVSDGTWDKRNVSAAGWLGQAMIYTALGWREKLRFSRFSVAERIRIENGVTFFKVYRQVMRRLRHRPVVPEQAPEAVAAAAARSGTFEPVAL
jgi:glycosyl transferase family 25